MVFMLEASTHILARPQEKPDKPVPVDRQAIESDIDELTKDIASLTLAQRDPVPQSVKSCNALHSSARDSSADLYARKMRIRRLRSDAACLKNEHASSTIKVSSQLASLELNVDQQIAANTRLEKLLEDRVYTDALRFYEETTGKIRQILDSVDATFIRFRGQEAVTKACRKICKLYEKTKQDGTQLRNEAHNVLYDAICFLQRKMPAKDPGLDAIQKELEGRFTHVEHAAAVQSSANNAPADLQGYLGRLSSWRYPQSAGFVRTQLGKINAELLSVTTKRQDCMLALSEGKELLDLQGIESTMQRNLEQIENDIERARQNIHGVDCSQLLLEARSCLRQLEESVHVNRNFLAFLKELNKTELQKVFIAQKEANNFFTYLEEYRAAVGGQAAKSEYFLALRCFKACNALVPLLSPSPSRHPFLMNQVQFLREALVNHIDSVFELTEGEKTIRHLLFSDTVAISQPDTSYTIRASIIKTMALYLFCRKEDQLPDCELQIIYYLVEKWQDVIDDDTRAVSEVYFSNIGAYRLADPEQLNQIVKVLQFIHQELLEKERDPLKFLKGWYHYFKLSTELSQQSNSSVPISLVCAFTTIANKLNQIAETCRYFKIDLNDLNNARVGLSIPGFIKALGEAICEIDVEKVRQANAMIRIYLQSDDFEKQIGNCRNDIDRLVSLILKNKLDSSDFTILPAECRSAIRNGFIKDALNGRKTDNLESDILMAYSAKILLFVENVDIRGSLDEQKGPDKPVLGVFLEKFKETRLKEWLSIFSTGKPVEASKDKNRLRLIAGKSSPAGSSITF